MQPNAYGKGYIHSLTMKTIRYVGLMAAFVAMFAIASMQNAYAQIAPDGQNWGEATKDFVPLGEHSSSQDEPRLGLGSLAQIFGSWCGLLEFLGFPCT